ncbi:hypothetical protein FQZ97_1179420 [compost metagenome]
MQQRLFNRRRVEVTRLLPEREVGHEETARERVFAHRLVFQGREHEPAIDQRERQHQKQRRKNPLHPAGVEVREAEAVARQVVQDDRTDQVARDHEEDVHPDEAARKELGEGMVDHHRRDGNGPQAIDVRAVVFGV